MKIECKKNKPVVAKSKSKSKCTSCKSKSKTKSKSKSTKPKTSNVSGKRAKKLQKIRTYDSKLGWIMK